MRAFLRFPAVSLAFVLFLHTSIVVKADCDLSIGFFSLPTVLYNGTLFLASGDTPSEYCKLKGYASHAYLKTGAMTRSNPFPYAKISTLAIESWNICVPCDNAECACSYIQIIECLPEGVEKCESPNAPEWATIGTGNNGFANHGNYNLGYKNNGNGNIGTSNVGNNNIGESIICNNKRGDSPCTVTDLQTSETAVVLPVPPMPPPPPPPPSPSPPPGKGGCDPGISFVTLPTVE
ncbi:hypothetical protein ACKKBF_B39770 [Auxenochlorella protothecoides x Auxenochlorella symbiontica]